MNAEKHENPAQQTLNIGKPEAQNPKPEINAGGTLIITDETPIRRDSSSDAQTQLLLQQPAGKTEPPSGHVSLLTAHSPLTLHASLLASLTSTFKRFVILPPSAAETLALWTVHTYCFEFRNVTTYIGLESPEKRCGKTTLLTVLSELVQRPVVAANISSSALFRVIEESRPTLLIDEADSFLKTNDELRGILNSGYTRKTAYVVRVTHERKQKPANEDGGLKTDDRTQRTEDGKETLPEKAERTENAGAASTFSLQPLAFPHASRLARFTTWCPKVMAAIGRLPDTLADRCIVIRMQRKTSRETCERLRNLDADSLADDLRRRCAQFALENQSALAAATPAIPPDLNDRAADIWEPLFAIADLAGPPWPRLARDAALHLAVKTQDITPTAALFMDILLAFIELKSNRATTNSLLRYLNNPSDNGWSHARSGRPLTDMSLAHILRPYGVRPKTMRIDGTLAKGYDRADFQDPFSRYIPKAQMLALIAERTAQQTPP